MNPYLGPVLALSAVDAVALGLAGCGEERIRLAARSHLRQAVDPPRRVEFTWGWTHDHAVPPGSTRVVVTLEAEDDGTRVILRHY